MIYCCRKNISLALRSYFYRIRNMLFSYWSFKIVLSIFDSARAPLVISHHRWSYNLYLAPHRKWTIVSNKWLMNETDNGLIIWPNSTVKTHDSYYKMHEWITTDLRSYNMSMVTMYINLKRCLLTKSVT
jgi:hypothetical protein